MFRMARKNRVQNKGHEAVSRAARVACEPLENRTMMSVVIHPVFGTEAQRQDNGTRLNDPPVYLILWGSSWGGTGTPQAVAAENAAAAVFNSPFLNTITQYGVSPHAHLVQTVWDGSNPANGFTTGDLDNVIQNQIDNGPLPEYDDTSNSGIYVVLTPQGINSDQPNAAGYNTEGSDYDFPFDIDNHLPEIWCSSSNSSVDRFSIILSHEMAEIMTDSGGNGIKFNPGASWTGGGSGNQIGDFEPNSYSFREPNGALVQPLWSRADNAIAVSNGTFQQFDLFPIWSGTSFTGQYNLVVNGDQLANHSDSVSVGETGSGGVSVTLNGETTFFDPGRIAHVQINSGNGNDNIVVQQTIVGTDIVSAGLATVHVGAGGNMQGIVAPLTIENPASFSTVVLDDSADSGARTGDLSTAQIGGDAWGVVSGLSPATVRFEYADTNFVTINTSGGGGTFNVQDTQKPTTIIGKGHTTINVGRANTVQSIAGALSIENPASYNTININDSGDGANRTVTLSTIGANPGDSQADSDVWGQITGLGSAAILYEYADTSSMTVNTGSGANTINVLGIGALPLGGATNLVGNSDDPRSGGGDTINVGNGGSVQGIAGTLNIEDPPSYDVVNIDDSADTTGRTATLSTLGTNPNDSQGGSDPWGQVVGLAPGHINYEYTDITSLTVRTGSGGNTIHVNATGVPTSIVGHAPVFGPDDTIDVGNGGMQDIASSLSLENPSGFDAINVNDNSDTVARTVTLRTLGTNPGDSQGNTDTWGQITGLAPAPITYEYADTHSLGVTLGVGGNTVNVQATGVPTTLLGGAVPIIIILPPTGSRIIPPFLHGGPNTINVTNAGSTQGIASPLTIENSWGLNTVTVDDSADTIARTVTLGTAAPAGDSDPFGTVSGISPGTITYESADVSSMTIDGGSGGNTFNVSNTPVSTVGGSGGTPITLNAGAGSDSINLSGQGAGTTLTVNGQAGNDTLTVIGANPADLFSVAAGQVTHGTSVANYAGVENLTLDPGTFNVTNDLSGIALNAIGAGTSVNFATSQTLAALTVNAASAVVASGGANVMNVNALSILGGGKLDLRDNSMQVHYGAGPDPIASVRSWITSGYAGGAFNGVGLNTGNADGQHGLGYADSADGVVAGLAAQTVLIKYALYGDANLDGHVNFADLLLEAQNYGKNPGTSMWDQGDTNYDGSVNFNDLLKIAQDFGL